MLSNRATVLNAAIREVLELLPDLSHSLGPPVQCVGTADLHIGKTDDLAFIQEAAKPRSDLSMALWDYRDSL